MRLSVVLDALRPSLHYAAVLGRLLTLPLRLAYVPLSYVLSALGVLFAPAFFLLSYLASWCRGVMEFIVALQPIYTFLGTAAAVGIFAGLTLATSSTVLTSYLGMQDGGNNTAEESRPHALKDKDRKPPPSPSLSRDDSSSNEGEWYWPDPAAASSRRRPATGLMSQTILEEEDDSDV